MPRHLRPITAAPRIEVVVVKPDPDGDPSRVRVTTRDGGAATMTVLAYAATCRPVTDGTFLDLAGVSR